MVSLDNLPEPYRVERILLSERYDSQTNDHDVALLKLAAPVAFDGQSEPTCSQISTPKQAPVSQKPKSPNRSSYITFRYVVLCRMEFRSERNADCSNAEFFPLQK